MTVDPSRSRVTYLTTTELAAELGVTRSRIRKILRMTHPRSESDKWTRWRLTPSEVADVRSLVLSPPLRATQIRDWFWEGSVQTRIAQHLEADGWSVVALADTASKQHGDDIRAERDGRVLRVEVKGFPSEGYADPRRAAERKRTSPSTQAGHWYSQALLRAMRAVNSYPRDEVAIGLPYHQRFVSLIHETETPLKRLRIGIYLVHETGAVEAVLPHVNNSWGRFVDQPGEVVIRPPRE